MIKRKKIILTALALLVTAVVGPIACLYILDGIFPFPMQRIHDRLSTSAAIIQAADGSLVSWKVDGDENRRLRVKMDDVSPWLAKATIAVEDKRFRSHPGVDPIAIIRALSQNVTAGRRISGASTITMQTIRLLWPRPRRLRSKVIEAFRAWQLERHTDKDAILELYFNLAPYGGNVVGVEAASRLYFGKSASQLNLAEASLLAGLPQSPARLNPLVHPEAAAKRRTFVLQRMVEDGYITREQASRARREDLGVRRGAARVQARHFAEMVGRQTRHGLLEVATTLRPDLQAAVSAMADRQGDILAEKGVSGPAVVVLSVADSSILAYVGNASPEGKPSREIDGVRARRQPGSLLKPFIFAGLAAHGKITPSSRVYDLPRSWNGYAPRNMDREWHGELFASEALRQSRNVTAVTQLEALGMDAFSDFMLALGLEPGRKDRHGLTVALGAKEQSLLNLTNAYACLARMGQWLPPRFLQNAPAASGHAALPPGAAWLTLAALSPPEDRKAPRLVWKTGTSWNQLDAWAIAITPELAVGVWCGRLGRGGSDWAAGGQDALPLALEIIAAATTNENPASWAPPREIEFREVCQESGALPGWQCRETALSPILIGNHERQFCRTRHEDVVMTSGPGEKETARKPIQRPLRILSPLAGTTYVADPRVPGTLPLMAEGGANQSLTWFVDGRRVAECAPGRPVEWDLRIGNHRVSVYDGNGGTATVDVLVEGL